MDMITNPSMAWLPPVILASIVVIAALIGFWNGWKTAVYFLGWNIAGFAAVIITMASGFTAIVNFVPETIGKMGLRQLILDNEETIKPLLTLISIILVLLVVNFIAFLIYWFFRRKLKRSMKKAKENGDSNFNSRFFGASVGVITALPIALSATVLSTVLSPKNDFTKFATDVTSGLTFNQTKNADKEMKEVVNLADAITDIDHDVMSQVFGEVEMDSNNKPKMNVIKTTDPSFNPISTIMNSKIVGNSMATILNIFIDESKEINFQEMTKLLTTTNPLTNKSINLHLFDDAVVNDSKQQEKIVKALVEHSKSKSKDVVRKYLEQINLF